MSKEGLLLLFCFIGFLNKKKLCLNYNLEVLQYFCWVKRDNSCCRYAGLFCTVLTGFAKGLDYRPGDKFKGTEYNHSWNAVYIDNNWYLVDSHWATRYLISEKNMPENLVCMRIHILKFYEASLYTKSGHQIFNTQHNWLTADIYNIYWNKNKIVE